MENATPAASTARSKRAAKAKPAAKLVSVEVFAERMAELATDTDSLNKFVGPKSVKACIAMCKLIADAFQENPAMRHKVVPPKKLLRH